MPLIGGGVLLFFCLGSLHDALYCIYWKFSTWLDDGERKKHGKPHNQFLPTLKFDFSPAPNDTMLCMNIEKAKQKLMLAMHQTKSRRGCRYYYGGAVRQVGA